MVRTLTNQTPAGRFWWLGYHRAMQGSLTFTRPVDVVADDERPGLLRARRTSDPDVGDVHQCDLVDLSAPDTTEPGLSHAGFETVDLSGHEALQQTLDEVREADRFTDATNAALRESLDGARFRLSDGTTLHIVHVVEDGLFNRRSGPNRLDVNPGGMDGANGHAGAEFVHGDQDVYGTPLRQLLNGAAPDTFRHVTPDGRNDDAPTMLLNLWIPLYAPVQPLALMDRRTLDARKHQLRYGLPVDGFLERDADERVNDIWSFLHDDGQQWYIHSDMDSGRGYVFDTLGTPHGAAVLAGEDAIEELYLVLDRACAAHDSADAGALSDATAATLQLRVPDEASPAIREIWHRLHTLHQQAAESDPEQWCEQARAAMHGAIRRSVEIRLVASPEPAANE